MRGKGKRISKCARHRCTYLLGHEAAKTVCDEYQWPFRILGGINRSGYLFWLHVCASVVGSLPSHAPPSAARTRLPLAQRCLPRQFRPNISVVPIGEQPGVNFFLAKLARKLISHPARIISDPQIWKSLFARERVPSVSIEAVDEHDAAAKKVKVRSY